MEKWKPEQVLTDSFRVSFCNLYESKPDMNGFDRFLMEMLFPKSRGTQQLANMLRIYNDAVARAKFSGTGPTPRTFKQAIIDGNSKKQDGRHGMFMLKANANKQYPPRLLMPNGGRAKSGDLYEGCWARALLTAYPYEAKNKQGTVVSRGASFNMLTVQRVPCPAGFTDDPFGSFVSEEDQDAVLAANPIEGAELANDDLDSLLA